MTRQPKYKIHEYYDIEGNYGQGWEVVTAASQEEADKYSGGNLRREALKQMREYDREEPGIPHRIRLRRERIYPVEDAIYPTE